MTKENYQIEQEIFDLEIEKIALDNKLKKQMKLIQHFEQQDARLPFNQARYDHAKEQYCDTIKKLAYIIDSIKKLEKELITNK